MGGTWRQRGEKSGGIESGSCDQKEQEQAEVVDLSNESHSDDDAVVLVLGGGPDSEEQRKGKRRANLTEATGSSDHDDDDVTIVDERGPAKLQRQGTTCSTHNGVAGPRPTSRAQAHSTSATVSSVHFRPPGESTAWMQEHARPARRAGFLTTPFGQLAGSNGDNTQPTHSWLTAGAGGAARIGWSPLNASRIAGMRPENLSLMMRELTSEDYDMLRSLDENVQRPQRMASDEEIARLCTLETVTVDREESADTRCFCLDTPTLGEKALTLPCGHWFHDQCVRFWLKRDKSCPICKRDISEYNTFSKPNEYGKRPSQ